MKNLLFLNCTKHHLKPFWELKKNNNKCYAKLRIEKTPNVKIRYNLRIQSTPDYPTPVVKIAKKCIRVCNVVTQRSQQRV